LKVKAKRPSWQMFEDNNFKYSSYSKGQIRSRASPASSDEFKFKNIERYDGDAYFLMFGFYNFFGYGFVSDN
jgi:hypothetical protein